GDAVLLCFGEADVGVLFEFDLAIQNASLDHQVADQVEILLSGSERCVHHTVERSGQRPTQEARVLIVVEAGGEIGRVLAVWPALLEPKSRARDSVYEHLHSVRPLVNYVLTRHKHAGHVIRPMLASMK